MGMPRLGRWLLILTVGACTLDLSKCPRCSRWTSIGSSGNWQGTRIHVLHKYKIPYCKIAYSCITKIPSLEALQAYYKGPEHCYKGGTKDTSTASQCGGDVTANRKFGKYCRSLSDVCSCGPAPFNLVIPGGKLWGVSSGSWQGLPDFNYALSSAVPSARLRNAMPQWATTTTLELGSCDESS
eukprot:6044368-Amphidinium_carterae.1